MTSFVRAEAGALVDDSGPLLLRGVGLGNWLVPEGYMWGLAPTVQSPRQIEAMTVAALGWEESRVFWRRWREEFVSDADLAALAAAGFDHVRLPLNWRLLVGLDGTPLAEGFATVDGLIAGARAHGLRVVLDLHAAPGGQTGTNIDDSAGLPELFLDPAYGDLTVHLWRLIAERYADDPTVMAFDLLNEPLPYQWADSFSDALVDLYTRITAAIRAVDPHHLLMYEGTRWATDFSLFDRALDPNAALQFHKYWSRPDEASIAPQLEAARRLGLPLYMGENGENTLDWNAAVTALYERCGISWCFWPHKKIDNDSGLFSVPAPPGWDAVTSYTGGYPDPAWRERAAGALRHLADSLRTDPATLNVDLQRALLRRDQLRLPASAYVAHSDGVRVDWPEQFWYDQGSPLDHRMGATVHVPAGGWVEYQFFGDRGAATPVVASGSLSASSVRGPAGEQRLRLAAVTDLALHGVDVAAR